MNYINLQLLNIDISSVFYYITSIFNDINFDIVLTIFLIINTLLAFSIVFIEYQTTTSSWAWILVLFLFPYLGFVLYLIFGRPIYREKIFPFSDDEKIKYQQNLLNYLKRKIGNEPINVDVVSESPTLCFTFWRKNALIIVYYNIFDDKEMIQKTIDAYLGEKYE